MGKFFSFSGRIGRYEYWIWSFGLIGMLIGAFVLEAMLTIGLFALVGSIAYFIGNLSLTVRRWHDRNKSGAWILIAFIPFIGVIWSFIELGFIEGTPGPNDYGWPYGTSGNQMVVSQGMYAPTMASPVWMNTAPQPVASAIPVHQHVGMSLQICPMCGDGNTADNRFCGKCGGRLQAPSVQPGESWNPGRI